MMASIVKLTHASLAEGKDPKMEITQWLLNFRNTPHPSTRKTPSELMMDRIVRTKVPVYITPSTSTSHREAQQNDSAARGKQKEYADRHRRARLQEVKVGDKVLLWQKKTTTKQPYDPDPYVVIQVIGTQITGERRGRKRVRNIEKWRMIRTRLYHLIPKRRRRSQQRKNVILEESSDSESDFEIIHQPRQEVRKEQNQDRGERHNEEEVEMLETQNEEEERRHRPVRVRRQPER